MQAHNNNIEEFLSVPRTAFVVPVYQRNYDWLDINCDQLFQDIFKSIETGRKHFLGTICFKTYNAHERSIIDGQQRLTSITLMLKALYDIVNDDDIKNEISHNYFFNHGHSIDSGYLKTKLHLNKRDDFVYHILLENNYSSIQDKLTAQQRESRIFQNYIRFYGHLQKYLDERKDVAHILESLRNLTIIELEVQDENPQEIFESLNSTGLDLTNVDLLRNYFLMQFNHEQQTKLYEDYWYQIENIIGVDNMEQFFVDYLVFKKRSDAININLRSSHITEKTLYTAFKNYYANLAIEDSFERVSYCFNDLKKCAEIYKNFIFNHDISIEKESKLRQKLYFLLTVNDSSKARSLLLYVFDCWNNNKINSEILEQVVDAISSITFRARICKAQGINRQFAGNVMLKLDETQKRDGYDFNNFLDSFWQAITSGKGSYAFPTDAEFRDALIHKDMYLTLRSRGVKYLLYMLEMHSPRPKGLPIFDDESITIEHVMPQTLDDKWREYLGEHTLQEYDNYLHRLGNLTLTNYNSEMSNKSFEDKKLIYQESKFYYSTKLTKYEKWGTVAINERSEILAEEAMKVWPLPSQYQKAIYDSSQLHKLDEDPSLFTFSKPNVIIIEDEEFVISAWNDFIPTICNKLIQEDRDCFAEIATPENIRAFCRIEDGNNYSDDPSFFEVIPGIFTRTAKSAASTLKTVLRIVQLFDEKAETEFLENITFALK